MSAIVAMMMDDARGRESSRDAAVPSCSCSCGFGVSAIINCTRRLYTPLKGDPEAL